MIEKAVGRSYASCFSPARDHSETLQATDLRAMVPAGWLESYTPLAIRHERIDPHLWEDKRAEGILWTHLRRKVKPYNKRGKGKNSGGLIKHRVRDEQRPTIVDQHLRVGDWKINTVIGNGHSGVLVTLVEGLTRLTLCARVDSKQL